jgi:hypothetical protein
MLAAYSLYLVYRRHRHPKTGQLLRRVIQMDPDSVLANRVPHLKFCVDDTYVAIMSGQPS